MKTCCLNIPSTYGLICKKRQTKRHAETEKDLNSSSKKKKKEYFSIFSFVNTEGRYKCFPFSKEGVACVRYQCWLSYSYRQIPGRLYQQLGRENLFGIQYTVTPVSSLEAWTNIHYSTFRIRCVASFLFIIFDFLLFIYKGFKYFQSCIYFCR